MAGCPIEQPAIFHRQGKRSAFIFSAKIRMLPQAMNRAEKSIGIDYLVKIDLHHPTFLDKIDRLNRCGSDFIRKSSLKLSHQIVHF